MWSWRKGIREGNENRRRRRRSSHEKVWNKTPSLLSMACGENNRLKFSLVANNHRSLHQLPPQFIKVHQSCWSCDLTHFPLIRFYWVINHCISNQIKKKKKILWSIKRHRWTSKICILYIKLSQLCLYKQFDICITSPL